ncbi:MAG: acyltransferase, partial [Pseudomonadota bacterium]
MSLPSTTRDYRPEIDGLRAVSVLAVAFFHAKIPVFSGGFVGVDIFFVISGFLITKIIWNEILEKRFSLLKFYERRARRILPALFVVVIFVIIFTILFKTPREARLFGESISFFGLFASNFFFLQERGYFEAPLEQFALLHTWSLAVEEQFYIFFPLILMALGSQTAGRTRTVVWALAGASFVAASILVFENRNMVFFSTPFRLWELALGSLLALGAFPAVSSRPLREALSALGAALIVVSVFAYDETLPFPGAAALAPCAGAALIIHANQNAGAHGLTLVGRGLAWGPVVFIGLVSYSFYLWHWPALSFAQYVAIRPLEPAETAGALALSFLLAVASLHLIERPFRRPGGVMPRGPLLASSALGLLACIGLGIALQESKGWPGRMPPDVLAMTTGDVIEMGVDRGCLTERDRLTPEARENVRVIFCRIGDVEETPKTLVWGDSHTLAIS